MIDDTDLLRCYAEDRSEEAFAELVSRHLSLVYSAALRQVNGDTHMAEDITQEVFTDLARKASSLARRPILASWLYTSTQFAASKAMRTLSRRRTREEEAHVMREQTHDPSPEVDWDQIRPVLDRAMHQLKQSDREALLLRFFEKHTLAEVGVRLALTEDAARMKVDRALVKLKPILAEYGIKSTVSGLAAVLTTGAVIAAPLGLSAKVAATAVATATVSGGSALTLLKLMSMTKLQTTVVGVGLLAGVSAILYLQHDANTNLRTELDQARSNSKATATELAQLREVNQRLAAIQVQPDELERLRADRQELLRLRGEVGMLRESIRAASKNGNPASAADLIQVTNTLIAKLYQQAADGDSDSAGRLTDYGALAVESLSRLTTNQLDYVRHNGLLYIGMLVSKGIDCSQAIPAAINGLKDSSSVNRHDALDCLAWFVHPELPLLESNLAPLEHALHEIELLMKDRFEVVRTGATNTWQRIKTATKKP